MGVILEEVKIDVLDHGYVKLLEYMGSDEFIAETAQTCTGTRGKETDIKALIYKMIQEGHSSPFEFAVVSFEVKLPIMVARQWMRHRTAAYNERSGRYTDSLGEYYSSKTGELDGLIQSLFDKYAELQEQGMKKEDARAILPMSMYTEFRFVMNLHNLMHFLKLRLSKGAQEEIKEYAKAILEILKKLYPITMSAFERYVLGSVTLSESEVHMVKAITGMMVIPERKEIQEELLKEIGKAGAEFISDKEKMVCTRKMLELGLVSSKE